LSSRSIVRVGSVGPGSVAVTVDTAAAPAPDLVGRLFDPDRPDVVWCAT